MVRVMVVDDARFMRTRLANLLTSNGYEVIEAENGQDAVDKFPVETPDLVLMDITMPQLDGISALKKIRETNPAAKVIMCSAVGQQSTVVEAVKAGAKDFIVKPFEPDKVLQAIGRHTG